MVGTPTSPASPSFNNTRPMSAMIRPARSSSRLSMSSKAGGSRASDEDGKTSVKVAVRVRPPLRSTDPGFDLIPQRFQKGMVHVTSPTSLAVDSPQGRKIFVFDRVFGQDVDQDGVWDYLEESVNAFIQGYNVSLLAYGQSGAGKSYTMGTSGPDEQSDVKVMGVIPRAATALFERLGSGAPNSRNSSSGLRAPARYSTPISQLIKSAADKGWTMKASYVEIYNEQLRDLLLPEGTRPEERVPITIREDTKGRILLTGLHQVNVNTVDDLLGALNFGSSIRQTDATAINAKSSRSHAVFSLNLVQRKPKGPASKDEKRFSMPTEMLGQEGYVTVDSKMHFVDLAGSERLKNTLAQGDRAKEGISINAGLASLGKVISQLSSRQAGSHVSYRDSKLTRLLQDSLGGNAITYMIACVTPAEFHLSETLNTVQYAQRARAIQSKPRIQQVSDDGDMKALVERLRAEIAFLREQLKNHSESSNGASSGGQTRSERANDKEREVELQNQLLDLQENYGALSQRHAKLISEITKVRDTQELSVQPNDYTDSAEDRLARSNSLSVAVEQVVLEYEKTIQSLETSLSSTRGLLSANESCLLEKETKLAYIETVNQQLQARVQKLMDRESSTENYLHDLETKLDGHTSGEEKNAAIIAELRKEIARIRENEAGCEDYISTLEERLAEADQDMELMQREIDRLEHVVDRQRSLGKLDNLLYELDSMNAQKEEKPLEKVIEMPEKMRNGRARPHSDDTLVEVPESVNGDDFVDTSEGKLQAQENGTPRSTTPDSGSRTPQPSSGKGIPSITLGDSPQIDYPPQSPAQSQFVADKLESVQQELFDLKVEHEATINEYDQMSTNYEAALRDLAALQDRLDEARHQTTPSQGTSPPPSPNLRPTSFLVGARVSDLKAEDQDSSSLSLLSELSLVGDSPISPVSIDSDTQRIKEELEMQRKISQEREEALARELETVKIQMEETLKAQEEEHDLLRSQLKQSLDQLSELRHRERVSNVISPSGTQILRRKSSQSLAILDRARRSFDNLHRIAAENFKDDPEILENFELNIDAALKELTTRSDRISELETEITSLRKEMDAKSAIITGLARERSSISTSPMDISVVAVMERRIEETQAQLNSTRELLTIRESDLAIAHRELSAQSGESTSDVEELLIELTKEKTLNAEKSQRISDLQREIVDTRQSHDATLESINRSKRALAIAVEDLEMELARSQEVVASERALKVAVEAEKIQHQERVDMLQKIVAENKATINSQLARVAELEKTHASTREQIDNQLSQTSGASESSVEDARKQHELAKELEQTIALNRDVIEDQQARLTNLEESYQEAIDQVEALRQKEEAAVLALKEAEARASEEISATNAKHEELIQTIRAELEESKSAIQEHVANLTRLQVTHAEAKSLIETLEGDKSNALEEAAQHAAAVKALETEMEESKATIQKHLDTISELQELHKQTDKEIEKLAKKEAKHAKLLEDLEQQLTFTFDQNQETGKKLADITAEHERLQQEKKALVAESTANNAESQQLIESLTDEVASLQTKLAEVQMELQGLGGARAQRSNSTSSNSNLRKSTSTTPLPSPPPAIPLPPLPGNASPVAGSAQPPPTPSMSRHPSKDYVVAHMEDQEARIKTLEKQLQAEKALTITLEEALTDCENKMKSLRSDRDSFQAKASLVQQELDRARNESQSSRYSMQAVEEERLARKKAELAREQLEVRMRDIAKKNKRSFACF
ncbi:kinesin-domain-containing protein [Choiromyces venosus 120613-1]|uniref:Kinesin-domain-containing protein n=1 Tax=Choiromyces venosus 120613-1 TaxID=1336337 RepID=A0A3N4JHS4_9PEZI|nr:kinesin-domain-containing protein [Choiromyces venosus 120613-1]